MSDEDAGGKMRGDDLPVPYAAPGERIAYGKDSLQFGELTVPKGAGPYPVLIWIHGGGWLADIDISHSRAFAVAAAREGVAVWNLEYRRVGNSGGGWPGTFLDIARGADFLRKLAEHHPLDLTRVISGGHSAGGHLAMWLATRAKISSDSEIYIANPLRPRAVLALAPAVDLVGLRERGTDEGAIEHLMGGPPERFPARYAAASPGKHIPLAMPQIVLIGTHDTEWGWPGRAYAEAARAAGDGSVTLIEAPDSGHFEMINPRSSTWLLVRQALRAAVQRTGQ